LEDKTSTYKNLRAWILQLPGVSEAPHRFGGTEFQAEGVEFMHSHGPSWFDIRLSRGDQESILKAGEALPHRFAPQAGWVSFRIEKPEDLANARKIIQLAYENARRNLEDIRLRKAQSRLG
jgi:luciferase-like monooxygenase